VFYDADNSAYYMDPNSTSVVNNLTATNNLGAYNLTVTGSLDVPFYSTGTVCSQSVTALNAYSCQPCAAGYSIISAGIYCSSGMYMSRPGDQSTWWGGCTTAGTLSFFATCAKIN